MREIKFRAWNTVAKYYWQMEDLGAFSLRLFTGAGHHYILEQFTGLHDKRGVEIYEGDICETPDGNKSVGWGLEGWEFKQTLKSSAEYIQPSLCYWGTPKIKVIGNVHENLELLK